ncbi:endothelin-converting enzyme 1-like [Pomacea canaliculata]|uniref:endothelin-converting enzyme 1-like n=1 Tax=Pomacea canaliculata TaxID=400727 RepID=UPI000D725509|nr:endothelin-converting enzyme 1-like [Pomacea canaliculata]
MNQTFDQSYEVVVVTKDYFPRLQKILSETDPQVVQDYLIFHLVQAIPGYLPQSFADAAMAINKVEFGISDLPPRWKRCISKAESAFGFAVSALYVEEHFPPESKAQAYEIVSAVRSAFIANLDNVPWMDQKTLQTAKIKAQTAGIQLGYPDWILNVTKLDKNYEMVKVTKGAFLDSYFSVSQAAALNTWSLLGTVPDTDMWSLKPHQVNAVFRSSYNELVILAGLLQRPFFDPRYPLSYTYGSTGSISGHELSHGFDDNGRKYDQHGNLNDWWSPSASQAFSEHTSCLVEEYSQFSIYGKHVNGEYTLGENIADNGGLKMAYAAYMKQRDGQPELRLPGLSLTPEQLYFLGFAQIWCSQYTPEYAIHSILTDEHAISRFRVLGSVANSPAFSKAYGCPAASPLNPVKKCQVW